MWVTDLVIEREKAIRRKLKPEILPGKERRSAMTLDIDGFLKRRKMRRTKERK